MYASANFQREHLCRYFLVCQKHAKNEVSRPKTWRQLPKWRLAQKWRQPHKWERPKKWGHPQNWRLPKRLIQHQKLRRLQK